MLYLSYPLSNWFEIEVHMTGYMIEPLIRVEFDSVRRKCEEVYRVAPCDVFEYYISDLLNLFGKYSAPFFQIMPSVGDQSWDHTREYFRDRRIIL